jgi:hypothetical protein
VDPDAAVAAIALALGQVEVWIQTPPLQQ